MDQLSGLRQILREQTVFVPPQQAASPWIWSICSGKGGTGKSLLAAGAALTLAQQGRKVLLLDGDFNLPGLQVFFNHLEVSNFFDYAADTLEIGNFISEINSYLHVLMPKSGEPLTSDRQMQLLLTVHQQLLSDYEILVADLPGGFSGMHRWFAENSCLITILIGQDYGSFANSYALIKLMRQVRPALDVGIWVNQTESEKKARLLHRKLNLALEHFLKQSVAFHGWLPYIGEIQQELADTHPMILWPSDLDFFRRLKWNLRRHIPELTRNEVALHAHI